MSRSTAPSRGREAAFATCLVVILAVGVLGVLLLNTVMQQQADMIAQQHQKIASLTQQAQSLKTSLDWQSDPARLAARAKALRLRPVKQVEFVSELQRATARVRAG